MRVTLLASAILALVAAPSSFAGDAAAGKAKSAMCATCHGKNGMATINTYPNLAGQNEQYLVSAMKAYKNKQRNGGLASVMQGQMANMSDTDIANLAAYYSSLK